MCSLVPLYMFHTPNMEGQCKLICNSGGRRKVSVTHLNRLLQYLHGKFLAFLPPFSPFSSVGLMASIEG